MAEYDFPVVREKLTRSDGEDTGYDTIFRPDTGDNLGVVSRKYQMLTHADAVGFTLDILNRMELPHDEPTVKLIGNGKRMVSSIKFPEMRFNPTEGMKGFDKTEDFDPVMKTWNSYDGSKQYSFIYGVEKLICTNGAVVFRKAQTISLRHVSKNINFEKIAPMIETSLRNTIGATKSQVKKLEEEDGFPYLRLLMAEEIIAGVYKRAIIEALGDCIETVKDERGRIIKFEEGVNPFTAYALWNIATNVASHQVKSAGIQSDIDDVIAKRFFK